MRDVTVEVDGVRYGMALAVIWPLVRRSAKFGPYTCLGILLVIVCGALVGSLTGSGFCSFLFGAFGWWVMGDAARHADMERVLRLWADEVANIEVSHD